MTEGADGRVVYLNINVRAKPRAMTTTNTAPTFTTKDVSLLKR